MKIISLALAFILFIPLGLGADTPVSLSINPSVGFAPLFVRVKITVEPNPDNRGICLTWDSLDAMYGTHCFPIYGEKTFWYDLKDLSAGDYVIKATLFRSPSSVIDSPELKIQVLSSR